MAAPVIEITSAKAASRQDAQKAQVRSSRLINPLTGYALAILISAAVWAMLLSVIF